MSRFTTVKPRWFIWLLFAGYTCCLLYWMFLGFHRTALAFGELRYNLAPFATISHYVRHYDVLGFGNVAINLAGNIVVFMPYGSFLPALFPGCRRYAAFAAAFVLPLLGLETLQTLLRLGSFDIDDVILNTFGASLAYAGLRVLRRLYKKSAISSS